MIPFLVSIQIAFLLAFAARDVLTRRVPNFPILILLLGGFAAALIEGPQWNPWNLLLPIIAITAWRLGQIGGADAKVLIALLPMIGAWVPWFLLGAAIHAAALHASTKRPPLLVAYAASYAVLSLWAAIGGPIA